MGRNSAIVAGVVALSLLGLAGCRGSKLNDERTTEVNLGAVRTVDYDAPKKDQQVTIELSSQGAPVNAYLVLAKDRSAAESTAGAGKAPANTLDKKEKVESGSLQATVPAGSGFVLILTTAGTKDAQVKLKATGK